MRGQSILTYVMSFFLNTYVFLCVTGDPSEGAGRSHQAERAREEAC